MQNYMLIKTMTQRVKYPTQCVGNRRTQGLRLDMVSLMLKLATHCVANPGSPDILKGLMRPETSAKGGNKA